MGVKLGQLDLFGPIRKLVRIPQKTVKYAPVDKLYEVFIGCLAGMKGICELEQCVRADPALLTAFGCPARAEQSVVQDTLNSCEPATVVQMQAACQQIFQQHSRSYRHDYSQAWLLLDVDMSGLPCGRKAALATKGYFAKQRNRRGRQLGRVLATDYDEVVVDRLFDGKTQLNTTLSALVTAAEPVLGLDAAADRRKRTLLRVDAGGGTLAQINWALSRGYHYHGKDYSAPRAAKLAGSVTQWYRDPRQRGREVGWVTVAAQEYVQPVRRLAVRCQQANGRWRSAVVVSTVAPTDIFRLAGQPENPRDPAAVALAYAYFYDQRGGGVESSIKADKQGLGMTRRNKKRFAAQEMLVQLHALAHNVLLWAKSWLTTRDPGAAPVGILRLVRDVFGIAGVLEQHATGEICGIVLNQADRWAHRLRAALQEMVGSATISVSLGQI
ncbi:MAG: transposase [Actinomycetota bacterium]